MPSQYYSAIDVGTNSFHMIIAEVRNGNKINIVDREREVIRLGSGKDGMITGEETSEAIAILKEFIKISDFYNSSLKAVATSAVRDAPNNDVFIKEVYSATGIKIEIADGKREAEMIYAGAKNALSIEGKKVLCADIGGGSTELIYDNGAATQVIDSLKLGAVRLSKMFFPDYRITNESFRECNDFVERTIKQSEVYKASPDFELAIGTAGTIQAAASIINYRLHGYGLKVFNNYSFSFDDLKDAVDLVLSFNSKEERVMIGGIEEKRADILPAGLIILQNIFELFSIEKMTVSSYALREGIILSQVSDTNKP